MNGFLHLAFNASFLVQLVMVILIGLSVWSWVIIFIKRKELNDILKSTINFNQKFWSGGINPQNFYMQIKEKRQKTPIEEIFYAGWYKYELLHGEEKLITPGSINKTFSGFLLICFKAI